MQTTLSAEDERAIASVILRYATGIDRRDWVLFRTCFTEDVRADYGAFGMWDDAAALTGSMAQMHAAMGHTLHRIGNIVAEPDGDGARARSYVDAVLCLGGPDDATHRAIGFYEDGLVRTGDGWRIRTRRFTLVRSDATGGAGAT